MIKTRNLLHFALRCSSKGQWSGCFWKWQKKPSDVLGLTGKRDPLLVLIRRPLSGKMPFIFQYFGFDQNMGKCPVCLVTFWILTCVCLETQCLSTLSTRIVAAVLITDSRFLFSTFGFKSPGPKEGVQVSHVREQQIKTKRLFMALNRMENIRWE